MRAVKTGNFKIIVGTETLASGLSADAAWQDFISRCHRFIVDDRELKLYNGDKLVAWQPVKGTVIRRDA